MSDERRDPPRDLSATRSRWTVRALVALFVGYHLTLCVLKWRAYGYGDFDLAIFDQAVWNTAHLNTPFSTSIRFGSVFADHVPLILLGAVPIYWLLGWLFPGGLILVAVQAIALGVAAFPLRRLGKQAAGNLAGVAVATAYLLHPATGYLALFEFHPGALAVPFLCWSVWELHAERFRRFVLFLVLALACREDVALPVAMLGVYALYRAWRLNTPLRSWPVLRWAVVPASLAIVWFAVAVGVVIPAAQPEGQQSDTTPFVQLYGHLVDGADGPVSMGDVAGAVITSPIASFERSSSLPHKHVRAYTKHLIAPTAGLALLSPIALLPALPTYALNVLSGKSETSSVCYQYTANLLPFLFLATALSLGWLAKLGPFRRVPRLAPCALILVATLSNLTWGKAFRPLTDPLGVGEANPPHQLYRTQYQRNHTHDAKDALVAMVPDDASVVATFDFLHRLPMRQALHSWHYVRVGFDPITGAPLETPDVEYALLDLADPLTVGSFGDGESGRRQRAYLRDLFVVAQAGTAVLLRRGRREGELYGHDVTPLIATTPRTPSTDVLDWQRTGLAIGQLNVSSLFERTDGRGRVDVRVEWAASQAMLDGASAATDGFARTAQLWLHFRITRDDDVVHRSTWPLDLGLHPLSEWTGFEPVEGLTHDRFVAARYALLLPPRLPPGPLRGLMEISQSDVPTAPAFAGVDLGEFEGR